VELHGGTVEAHSAGIGSGALFTVRIPLAPLRSARPPEMTRHVDSGAAVLRSQELAGLRLLVVDDEADTREMLESVLIQSGAAVVLAQSVDDALAHLDSNPFDAIVSDVGMPGKDGYDLMRQVRKRTTGGFIPAIALTAYARSEDRTATFQAGFQVHVPKPIDPTELIAVIVSLTRRHNG
jgi:CheY-like chemotaxis protein